MLKLELVIDELDYDGIFDQFGSVITEKLKESGNPAGMLPPAFIKGFVTGMPAKKRDKMAAELINANRGKLQRGIEELAASKGIKLLVVSAKAETEE